MTKDDMNEQDLSSDTTKQQQQNPFYTMCINVYQTIKTKVLGKNPTFQVVLIDLAQAADHQTIHCVKKPLEGIHDLSFVAISYRWGEVQETMVDTGVGYVAAIRSFDLPSFFKLCKAITEEVDLHQLRYVWVDAICINQTNPQERKTTIYHMTDIYERANYIVAVPDLHKAYLQKMSSHHRRVLDSAYIHRDDLYYLLHGNTQALMRMDRAFLSRNQVPTNPHLRYLLTHYTEHFALGFTTPMQHGRQYDSYAVLQHIYQTTNITTLTHPSSPSEEDEEELDTQNMDQWHICTFDDLSQCPLKQFNCQQINPPELRSPSSYMTAAAAATIGSQSIDDRAWKKAILDRSHSFGEAVRLMKDLVIDWSTRVWVVSEFSIAKRKPQNKMKYWFIALGSFDLIKRDNERCSFFEFDFGYNDTTTTIMAAAPSSSAMATAFTRHTTGIVQPFHATMRYQLAQRTFIEMILKSNASRQEDRFYAILPSVSQYKGMVKNNKARADQWQHKLKTLACVKLELYQWMTTHHKLQLLFLSGFTSNSKTVMVLPSFATGTIDWPPEDSPPIINALEDPTCPSNFDLSMPSTIQLVPTNINTATIKLVVKPREYYSYTKSVPEVLATQYRDLLYKLLRMPTTTGLDLIVIPALRHHTIPTDTNNNNSNNSHPYEFQQCHPTVYDMIFLIGCASMNQWLLSTLNYGHMLDPFDDPSAWQLCYCNKKNPRFDIY